MPRDHGQPRACASAGETSSCPCCPLRDLCLFPEASLAARASPRPAALRALEIAQRTGGRVLALAQREPRDVPRPRDLHEIGTVARVAEDAPLPERRPPRRARRAAARARVVTLIGVDAAGGRGRAAGRGRRRRRVGPRGGGARPLPARPRRPALVPRPAAALEGADGLGQPGLPAPAHHRHARARSCWSPRRPERCLKISRGLDALLRKEQGA